MSEKKIFNSPKETAAGFGDYLMKSVGNDPFHCALSGGSTPKLLFQYLAEMYSESDKWENLHFYWGDERCVPPADDESNYKMTKELLLNKVPIPESNIHRIHGEADPAQEAIRYGELLVKNIPLKGGLPVFDMIILGLGGDGHTASIFPHQMELLKSSEICEVATHPESGQKRVTLTGPVINAALEVVFLVTGGAKKEKVSEIVHRTGNWKDYPASHIQPRDGHLIWFLDRAAAD